jgi:hypothetical protein
LAGVLWLELVCNGERMQEESWFVLLIKLPLILNPHYSVLRSLPCRILSWHEEGGNRQSCGDSEAQKGMIWVFKAPGLKDALDEGRRFNDTFIPLMLFVYQKPVLERPH